jgi:hypothetical protein
MQEGRLTHEEINRGIAVAEKTIIFARQNRLRDGVMLPDRKLPRFHAGHDTVKFFYSAVRQLPEYFLDALRARDISVTLVTGQGMLAFKDVRNWCAVHAGLTRRTIYLPEKILEIAFQNGYDYWSIAHILVTQGWKLLDFCLLYELVEAVRLRALEHRTTVVGYSTFRRLLRQRNRHRSSYESPDLMAQRERHGLTDMPINELQEFTKLYEPRFVRDFGRLLGRVHGGTQELTMQDAYGVEQRVILNPENAEALSSDAVAKLMYDAHYQEVWAQRKSSELFDELGYPDFFLLDRDILHPAARELAESAGQRIEPQSMDDARHDYRDHMRFGIGTSFALENLLAFAPTLGADGIQGLIEEVLLPLVETGATDKRLEEPVRAAIGRKTTHASELYIYYGRAFDLIRFRDLLAYWKAVRSGERVLHVEDMDVLRRIGILLAATKGTALDPTRIVILNQIDDVQELFDNLRALLVSEANRLFDEIMDDDDRCGDHPHREMFNHFNKWTFDPTGDHAAPPFTMWNLLNEQIERAVTRATLCLDLSEDYARTVTRLLTRGQIAREVVRNYVDGVRGNPELQIVVQTVNAALGMEGEISEEQIEGALDDAAMLAELVTRVSSIVEALPERLHTGTSGIVSPVRRALREFEHVRRRHPTDPDQLGHLAMVLVRLDRLDNYDELLDHIRWMGRHAIGKVLRGSPLPTITPGLLRVSDVAKDEGDDSAQIQQMASELAMEIMGEPLERLMKTSRWA